METKCAMFAFFIDSKVADLDIFVVGIFFGDSDDSFFAGILLAAVN